MDSAGTRTSEGFGALASGPSRWGLFDRPRTRPDGSFRAFLQTLTGDEPRGARSFGGLRSVTRCERGAADLLFLFYEGTPPTTGPSLRDRILLGAERFGYKVQVEAIERREVTGRDIYSVREITGRAFDPQS